MTIGERFGEVKNLPVFPRKQFEEQISSSRNPLEAGADATNCVGIPGGEAISPGNPGGRLVSALQSTTSDTKALRIVRAQKRSATGLTSRD